MTRATLIKVALVFFGDLKMQIVNAIKLTSIVCSVIDFMPLSTIEEKFVEAGWKEGSFGVFKIQYADYNFDLYLDYPTDLTEEEAQAFAKQVINNL